MELEIGKKEEKGSCRNESSWTICTIVYEFHFSRKKGMLKWSHLFQKIELGKGETDNLIKIILIDICKS